MARLYLVRRLCSVARNHLEISFSELVDRFCHILENLWRILLFSFDAHCGDGCGDGYGFVGFLGNFHLPMARTLCLFSSECSREGFIAELALASSSSTWCGVLGRYLCREQVKFFRFYFLLFVFVFCIKPLGF